MKSLIVILALAGGCALGASSPVHAASVFVQQQGVHYRLSELSSPEGLSRLYSRLNGAAARVCGNYTSPDLLHTAPYQRCVAESVARAVAQIHDERLSRYHDLRISPVTGPVVVSSSAIVVGG
jgi:UrcA family protein